MRSAKLKTPISNLKRQETDRPAPADVSMLRQTLSDLIVVNSDESFLPILPILLVENVFWPRVQV